MDNIKTLIRDLAETEENLGEKEEKYKEEKKAFEDRTESVKKEIDRLRDKKEDLRAEVADKTAEEFKTSGRKKFPGGIKVQERRKLEYDRDKAFEWAKDHDMCLKLDTKAFEKTAESVKPDFVEIKTEPKTTFPSKGINTEELE